jgi:hypothetical protein
MSKLVRYTLTYDERRDRWPLKNDRSKRIVKTFDTKREAVAGGALKRAVGREGGVRSHHSSA